MGNKTLEVDSGMIPRNFQNLINRIKTELESNESFQGGYATFNPDDKSLFVSSKIKNNTFTLTTVFEEKDLEDEIVIKDKIESINGFNKQNE